MTRSKVAVLRASPETILDDIDRLCELGGVAAALTPGAPTIHLVALSVPRREHHAVAARGHGPGAAGPRLRRSGLRPEQDRRHRRLQG